MIRKLYYEADDMAKVGKVCGSSFFVLECYVLIQKAIGRHRHSERDLRSRPSGA